LIWPFGSNPILIGPAAKSQIADFLLKCWRNKWQAVDLKNMADVTNTIQCLDLDEEMRKFEDCMKKNSEYYDKEGDNLTGEVDEAQLTYNTVDDAVCTLVELAKEVQVVVRQGRSLNDEEQGGSRAVEEARERVEKREKEASEARKKRKKSLAKLEVLQGKLAERGDMAKGKRDELVAEMEKYKTAMGLDIVSSTHGGVLLVFTNIDKQEPDRRFTLHLATEAKTYRADECSPHLEDLEKLVNILNKTNDLSGFLVKLRQKFKQSVV